MKVKFKADKGKIVSNRDGFLQVISNLDGLYIATFTKMMKPKTIDEWRKHYFFLRDILFEDGETGYTKNELHELTKEHVLDGRSTTELSEDEWETFIKDYKIWVFSEFNCYL